MSDDSTWIFKNIRSLDQTCPHCRELVVPRFLRDAHIPMCARLASLSAELEKEREAVMSLGPMCAAEHNRAIAAEKSLAEEREKVRALEVNIKSQRQVQETYRKAAEAQAAQWKAGAEVEARAAEEARKQSARYRSALEKIVEHCKLDEMARVIIGCGEVVQLARAALQEKP